MRINHVIKTDQWRCAPQIRPAPHFVASLENVLSSAKQAVRVAATLRPAPVTLTFDLESGVRVTCDVGYLCADFSVPRPLDVGPMYATDVVRQTSDAVVISRGNAWECRPHCLKYHQNVWERRSHAFWRFRRKIN